MSGLLGELAPLHPRNDTFPGEVSSPRFEWLRLELTT
jgi:hypothetical protein